MHKVGQALMLGAPPGAAAAGVSGLVAVERAFASDMISLEQRDALIADLAV